MAVDPDISRAFVHDELQRISDLEKTYGWNLTPDPSGLRFRATMRAHTGDLFLVEFECTNYREHPPLVEFIDPRTGAVGTRCAYPKSHDSFFHESGPCICAPFNRKAYKALYETGPHSDWDLGNWAATRANGFDWSRISSLGDMLGVIQARLNGPATYRGRMG